MQQRINLFVPGRLCLFGEHSDWAGMYRTINSEIARGIAIVSGTEQGIYAAVEKADRFIMCGQGDDIGTGHWECEMDTAKLLKTAQKGGYFSYVAGVAAYINDNYRVSGMKITVLKQDLPIKSGLSSSAAICVLVARAFNQLYHLNMNVKGEMQAAFRGEQKTPSRCGRLDQACAYGVKPVLMEFDGVEIESKELRAGGTFYWVIANLMASKDTIKILADLNRAYPFAHTETDLKVQEALGADNRALVQQAIEKLESGDARGLGELMVKAQAVFDEKVMPACNELKAPVLHSVLNDPIIKEYTYGAKGVGSQGDGSVQFLAKSEAAASKLQKYLLNDLGMPSFTLTIRPGQTVRKAIIPLAGFGTRVFPATKVIPKCFLPVLDKDGLLKPALLIILEQLIEAGIEEIALIIGRDDKEEFERLFAPLPDEYLEKLSFEKKSYENQINRLGEHITYIYQDKRKGFGHAVYLAKDFSDKEPALLLLGDFLYNSTEKNNCCRQVIDAYKECGHALVAISEVSLPQVVHYGIMHGVWDDDETLMKADAMVEKPTDDYAKEHLGVINKKGERKYYAVFGQYVITPEVFDELEIEISSNTPSEGVEYGLTKALDNVRKKHGLYGFVPKGKSYDIGLPEAYRQTMCNYGDF